jgi:hypothetical protein
MTLPNDYTFCPGTTHPNCAACKRRRPGGVVFNGYMQMHSTMLPPIDLITGRCPELIAESIATNVHTQP